MIIPQLFSRLNHHEPYVRKRVSELLCRVAKDSPHLIIFPAVVGAIDEGSNDMLELAAAYSNETDCTDSQQLNPVLTKCSNSLLETLSTQAAQQVRQVQMLVRELKRITLLWEELWASSLTQIFGETGKRMTTIETEISEVLANEAKRKEIDEENRSILAEKYKNIVRPVLLVMERLHKVTSSKAETPNEMAFQERFHSIIEDILNALRQPLVVSKETPEAWIKFKKFYTVLQQRSQKRLACSLKMADISPALSKMKGSLITMPGVEHHTNRGIRDVDDQNRWIYVQSVENFVHILPTKTKPKKLAFYGSDGRRYNYLFKGLEDLHLDERIMQFLSIANSMMSKTRTSIGQSSKYRGKCYAFFFKIFKFSFSFKKRLFGEKPLLYEEKANLKKKIRSFEGNPFFQENLFYPVYIVDLLFFLSI